MLSLRYVECLSPISDKGDDGSVLVDFANVKDGSFSDKRKARVPVLKGQGIGSSTALSMAKVCTQTALETLGELRKTCKV